MALRRALAMSLLAFPAGNYLQAQNPAAHGHEGAPIACEDVPAGSPRPEFGCFNIATVNGLKFPDSLVYWHLLTFPSRAEAEAARSPSGVVVEEDGRVWLNELGAWSADTRGGTRVAVVGPLVLPRAPVYSAVYSYAVMKPGQRSRVHTHPGPEGWYVLAGEQCLETSVGVFRGHADQTVVAPGNVPMELMITGNQIRRALVVVVHDARKERGTPVPWKPKGLC
jgi:quercetin dioxygenase-like cupin family protein